MGYAVKLQSAVPLHRFEIFWKPQTGSSSYISNDTDPIEPYSTYPYVCYGFHFLILSNLQLLKCKDIQIVWVVKFYSGYPRGYCGWAPRPSGSFTSGNWWSADGGTNFGVDVNKDNYLYNKAVQYPDYNIVLAMYDGDSASYPITIVDLYGYKP